MAKSEKRGGRTYPRLFAPHYVLYVGGSSDLRNRFVQHLGYGHKATSALQLAHWAGGHDVAIEFIVARYPADVPDAILGALKDSLWDELKPMLGRQGRR